MIDRPQISIHADHDMRHYQFQRTSGLPHGTFDRPIAPRITWVLIAAAMTVVAFAAVVALQP